MATLMADQLFGMHFRNAGPDKQRRYGMPEAVDIEERLIETDELAIAGEFLAQLIATGTVGGGSAQLRKQKLVRRATLDARFKKAKRQKIVMQRNPSARFLDL